MRRAQAASGEHAARLCSGIRVLSLRANSGAQSVTSKLHAAHGRRACHADRQGAAPADKTGGAGSRRARPGAGPKACRTDPGFTPCCSGGVYSCYVFWLTRRGRFKLITPLNPRTAHQHRSTNTKTRVALEAWGGLMAIPAHACHFERLRPAPWTNELGHIIVGSWLLLRGTSARRKYLMWRLRFRVMDKPATQFCCPFSAVCRSQKAAGACRVLVIPARLALVSGPTCSLEQRRDETPANHNPPRTRKSRYSPTISSGVFT
jgi:hypothetical protein